MSKYKVLINSVRGVRKLVPYNDEFYSKAIESLGNKKEAYESIYIYNQEHFDKFKETKSLAGIKDVVTDKVVFDFDSKTQLQKAQLDTIKLIERLKADGFTENQIGIYFSGNKGFHVEVNLSDDPITREEFETITHSYAGDLETFDTAVSDEQRVFRLPLSFNTKSEGHKIPLTHSELTTDVQQILEYSKSPNAEDCLSILGTIESAESNKFVIRDKGLEKIEAYISNAEREHAIGDMDEDDAPDFAKNKTGLTNTKFALASGYFEEGERHEAVMILASTYKALGWPIDNAYGTLKSTIRQRNKRLGLGKTTETEKEELWNEISSVYSPTWKGGTYDEDKNSLLIKTKKRFKIEDKYETNMMMSLSQVDDIFSDFAENIDKNTLKLGIASFDEAIRITTGTLVSLLAAPSVGKSSISFGILNSTSKENIKSMFFSLDMGAPQVYQRVAQKHLGITSKKLFAAYKNKDKITVQRVRETMKEEYSNVKFCFKGAMNVDIIRDSIIREREITGEYPKLVVVDYLENVMTSLSNDPTIAKGFVARSLKDIANEFAICILLLVQPAKVTGGPSEELNSYYNIKGSGLVAEASAQVITMHRPGFNPKDSSNDDYINLTVVKNRMGELGTFDYHWTGLTGNIRELVEEERKDLEALRRANAESKDEGGGFTRFGSKNKGADD